MDRFMRRALELARENVREGGQPFGAVLVMDGEAVAEGVNELHLRHDVSGHAELLAVRRAQAKLQRAELKGAVMYASGEPCAMCLAAMYFAGIEEVYYCRSVEDAAAAGLGKSGFIYDELRKPKAERTMKMTRLPLAPGEVDPLRAWAEKQK